MADKNEKGIINYDFDEIDMILLKTNEIKDKHIYPRSSEVKTSKTVLKNHYKKLT